MCQPACPVCAAGAHTFAPVGIWLGAHDALLAAHCLNSATAASRSPRREATWWGNFEQFHLPPSSRRHGLASFPLSVRV